MRTLRDRMQQKSKMLQEQIRTSFLNNRRNRKAGMTLVELIVCFALLGLFFTAASFVITSSSRLFYRLYSTSSAVSVSNIILDKAAGELAGADNKYKVIITTEDSSDGSAAGGLNGYSSVAFATKTGSPAALGRTGSDSFGTAAKASSEDVGKYLLMQYYPTKNYDKMNPWTFDRKLYQNYEIQRLAFSKADPLKNVIKIDLTIFNPRTGFSYDSIRYASCANFTTEEEIKNITEGNWPEDSDFKDTESGGGGVVTPTEPETEAPTETPAPTEPTTETPTTAPTTAPETEPTTESTATPQLPTGVSSVTLTVNAGNSTPQPAVEFFTYNWYQAKDENGVPFYFKSFTYQGKTYCIAFSDDKVDKDSSEAIIAQTVGVCNEVVRDDDGKMSNDILKVLSKYLNIADIKEILYNKDKINNIKFN